MEERIAHATIPQVPVPIRYMIHTTRGPPGGKKEGTVGCKKEAPREELTQKDPSPEGALDVGKRRRVTNTGPLPSGITTTSADLERARP